MEKLRTFGGKNDSHFWSDKPMQKNHPNKTNWYHIHWYNIPYNPTHKSEDGLIEETMSVTLYKCRCGKCKHS